MTREEARRLRDDNIQFCREGILERPSDEIFEVNDVLEVIDDIIIEIEKYDKHIEALQERPKGRWEYGICSRCGYDCNRVRIVTLPNYCENCGADCRERDKVDVYDSTFSLEYQEKAAEEHFADMRESEQE